MKTLKDIQDKIISKDKLHFIFDYNSRITPYIRTSMSYFFSPMFKRIAENLAKKEFISVSIITDKNVKNFKSEFPVATDNVNLYTVFGAETEIQKEKKSQLDDVYKKTLKKLYTTLTKTFADNKKLIPEFEDWSIIVNSKGASKEDTKAVKKIINDFIKKNAGNIELKIAEEENKISVLPADFNLNNLLDKLVSKYEGYTTIYVGSNETSLKYLKKKCSTLKVVLPGETLESKAEIVVFRSKFEEFLADTNNLYL